MADLQHTALTSAQVHEPKHITSNSTGSSGRVITNSSSVAGTSEYRNLKSSEIDETDVYITGYEVDTTAAEDTYFISPVSGTLEEVSAIHSDPLVGADNIYTFTVGGNPTVPATMTITQAASVAGGITNVALTSGSSVVAGDAIQIRNNGGNTDVNVKIWFLLKFRRV